MRSVESAAAVIQAECLHNLGYSSISPSVLILEACSALFRLLWPAVILLVFFPSPSQNCVTTIERDEAL